MEIRAKYVYESIKFERGRDPRKSMDVGIAIENRDPNKMKENFERDFPMFRGHTGKLHSSEGTWTTYTAAARNPKDGKAIEDRQDEIIDWFETHTDYDVVKLESAFDRRFHPWGDSKMPLEWDQQFTVHLGYKDQIKESYNFERGQNPKGSMMLGNRREVLEKFINAINDDLEMWAELSRIYVKDGYLYVVGRGPDFNLVANKSMKKHGIQEYLYDKVGETIKRKEEKRYPLKAEYFDLLSGLDTSHSVLESVNIKVNKDPDDWASRSYDDEASRHYYILGFKKGRGFNESVNFERGQDPKTSMGIGKASKPNYFRDHLEGISYKEWMLDNTDWPWGEGKDILEIAADMFGVSENEVLIAVEYDNDPLTTSRIEEVMEMHEWEYGDSEGNTDSFDLVSSSTGEIYVVDREEGLPYMILGTEF